MNRPLSGLEPFFDMAVQMERKAQSFCVAYMVFGPDPDAESDENDEPKSYDWILGSFFLSEDTATEAERKVLNWAKWNYKECAGYIKHKVHADRVNDIQLANAGYFRP